MAKTPKNTTAKSTTSTPKTPSKKAATDNAAAKTAAAKKAPAKKKSTGTAKTSRSKTQTITADERRQMIAEAAYLRSEVQRFCSDEQADWLQAEAEVDKLLAKAKIGVLA